MLAQGQCWSRLLSFWGGIGETGVAHDVVGEGDDCGVEWRATGGPTGCATRRSRAVGVGQHAQWLSCCQPGRVVPRRHDTWNGRGLVPVLCRKQSRGRRGRGQGRQKLDWWCSQIAQLQLPPLLIVTAASLPLSSPFVWPKASASCHVAGVSKKRDECASKNAVDTRCR